MQVHEKSIYEKLFIHYSIQLSKAQVVGTGMSALAMQPSSSMR